jgi:outer membrane protein OmpA-like peptidoglycan-associated protein
LQVERFTTPAGSFLPGEAALSARGQRFLRSLRGRLVAVAALRCEGHSAQLQAPAVATGPLSLARAALLCRTLRTLGVRVLATVLGRGNAQPVASNASEAGRAENRRVEVTIRHRSTAPR